MVIDSGMLTSEAYAGKLSDSSGWINASSGIFSTSAASEKADGTRWRGHTRAEDRWRKQKDPGQSCGWELKERVDGNVTGLMALSIK